SKAHWKLPIKGDKDLCEFVFHQGKWSLKIYEPSLVQGQIDFDHIKAGDQLLVGDLRFMVKMSSGVEEIFGVARKFSILQDSRLVRDEHESLESYCASLFYSQAIGELQVKSAHKRGIIFFYAGVITASVA